MKGLLTYKSITAEVKDVDVDKKIVTGYFSAFNNKDYDGDVIVPGAFAKSIAERGPQGTNEIFFLNQHNWNQPLGRPYLLQEDAKGLYFESNVTDASFGKDAMILYSEGLVAQHSIGFVTTKSDTKGDTRYLQELYLYEGSAVTLGANDQTPFTGFKARTFQEQEGLMTKMVNILKKGSLTDETFLQIEIALKQLQLDAYNTGKSENSLKDNEPILNITQEVDKPNYYAGFASPTNKSIFTFNHLNNVN